jgi:hypothetical protein
MSRLLVLSIFACCTFALAETSIVRTGLININEYSDATQSKLKALKSAGDTNTCVRIGRTVTQSDFAAFCKDAAWVTTISLDHGNEHISSLEPLQDLPNLVTFDSGYLKRSNDAPIDLEPLSELRKLETVTFTLTYIKNFHALNDLQSLKVLQLWNVNSLEFIKGNPGLEDIVLYGNGHSFKNYKPLLALKKLKSLSTYMNNQANDRNLGMLSGLTTLEAFASGNNSWATTISFLKNCQGITTINMWNARRLWDISVVKDLPKLENLDITGTKVLNLKPLSGNTTLKHLSIAKTKISIIRPLENCQSLETVNLSRSHVTDLSPLLKSKNLKEVIYSDTVPQDQIAALRQRFPDCRLIRR